MFDRKRSRWLTRLGLTAVVLGATASTALFSFTSAASAATYTTTNPLASVLDVTAALAPESLTGCSGKLSAANALGKDWYNYKFSCAPAFTINGYTGNVLAYSLIVGREQLDGNNVAANNSPTVYAGGNALTTESVYCTTGGQSDGFNCSGGAPSSTNLGYVPASDTVEGSFELTASYCKYLPKKKAGTLAVPRAVVDLIVTDASGAQDGPFELRLNKRCPTVASIAK